MSVGGAVSLVPPSSLSAALTRAAVSVLLVSFCVRVTSAGALRAARAIRPRPRSPRSERRPVPLAIPLAVTALVAAPAVAFPADDATDDRSFLPGEKGAPGSGPEAQERADPPPPPAPVAPPPRYEVVVGDCLWTIAAGRLDPLAPDFEIDSFWREIYAANHAVIGDDPDLIHPGQILEIPVGRSVMADRRC